ncbi:hypothetical protein RYX36_036150 [Vicia faba]
MGKPQEVMVSAFARFRCRFPNGVRAEDRRRELRGGVHGVKHSGRWSLVTDGCRSVMSSPPWFLGFPEAEEVRLREQFPVEYSGVYWWCCQFCFTLPPVLFHLFTFVGLVVVSCDINELL